MQDLKKYRVRLADNKIQYFVEEDINFLKNKREETFEQEWKITAVRYSKSKATKAMYSLINKDECLV